MEAHQQLEESWAEFNDLNPAGMVACSSGTAALHLALEALELLRGSEVITSDFNMIAVPRAVTLAGLIPVFVDCDERLLMDVELINHGHDASTVDMPNNKGYSIIEEYGKIEVVLAVHVYGRRCVDYMDQSTTAKWNVAQIEDLAEAHGVQPHESTDAACWSFYANKIVAGQEGGAVWFRDPQRASLARQLRSLGFTDAHDFRHVPRGHNYRMSNAHAELVLGSLRAYQQNEMVRREHETMYDAHLKQWSIGPRNAPWVYDVRLPGLTRERQGELVRELQGLGISARMGFWPMSMQREYQGCRHVLAGLWGSAEHRACLAAHEVLYLPLTPGGVSEGDVRRAAEVIARCAV